MSNPNTLNQPNTLMQQCLVVLVRQLIARLEENLPGSMGDHDTLESFNDACEEFANLCTQIVREEFNHEEFALDPRIHHAYEEVANKIDKLAFFVSMVRWDAARVYHLNSTYWGYPNYLNRVIRGKLQGLLDFEF